MAKVRTVTVKRTKQVAKYEPETVELVVDLGPKDTVSGVVRDSRLTIARLFGEAPTDEELQAIISARTAELKAIKEVKEGLSGGYK